MTAPAVSPDFDELRLAVAEAYAATTRAFSASVIELCGALDADADDVLAAAGLVNSTAI